MPGLDLRSIYSYDNTTVKDHIYYSANHYKGSADNGNVNEYRTTYEKMVTSTTANYTGTFDKHTVGTMVGFEAEKNKTDYVRATGSNLAVSTIHTVSTAGTQTSAGYSWGNSMVSVLSKLDYNYDERYFISGSYRRDGSSRLSKQERWGNFWSLGASWRVDRESFMASTSDWLSALTLKMSYGAQGNDNLGTYYASKGLYSIVSNLGENALVSDRMATPNLKWETNLNFNVGIDFSLFNNRFSGSFDFFTRRSKDLLYSRPIAPSLGYGSIDENVGALKNTGIEMVLNGTIINQNGWVWKLGMNLTHYKNKVTDLPLKDMPRSGVNKLQVGRSVYDFYMIEWAGVDPENGDPLWYMDEKDANGKVTGRTVTEDYTQASKYELGSTLPDFQGGFSTDFAYKGIDLSIATNFQIGGKIYDSMYSSFMHAGSNIGSNWHKDILNAWTPENKNTNVPIMDGAQNSNSQSSRFLINASFFNIRNISLGYTFPKEWMKAISASSARIYVSADNVALFSKRKGMDPRQYAYGYSAANYSAIRTLSFGINLNF